MHHWVLFPIQSPWNPKRNCIRTTHMRMDVLTRYIIIPHGQEKINERPPPTHHMITMKPKWSYTCNIMLQLSLIYLFRSSKRTPDATSTTHTAMCNQHTNRDTHNFINIRRHWWTNESLVMTEHPSHPSYHPHAVRNYRGMKQKKISLNLYSTSQKCCDYF